ncbi:MAG: DUF1799 domain-containing protein [Betaproteobacteria bacterium]|nr:DUF1799 domain-containing protein [Betaproteobacteria bacterium]
MAALTEAGVPEAEAWAQMGAETEDDGKEVVELWPENEEAFWIFCGLATQWRLVAGMGGVQYQGLDYAALWPTLDGLGVKDPPAMFRALQVMERAALPELNRGAT